MEDLISFDLQMILDSRGYIDQQCRKENCFENFKLDYSRYHFDIKGKEMFCPYCGFKETYEKFFPDKFIENLKARALRHAAQKFQETLKNSFRNSDAVQYVDGTLPPDPGPIPSSDPFLVELECKSCYMRFSTKKDAQYCPGCGGTTIKEQFTSSVDRIIKSVENRVITKGKIPEDQYLALEKNVLESAISNLATLCEVSSKTLFIDYVGVEPTKGKGQIFQRLDDASRLWCDHAGKPYEFAVGDDRFKKLKLFFQMRHVLQHNAGTIDRQFIKNANILKFEGGPEYFEGQRLVITEEDVREMAKIVSDLVCYLEHGEMTVWEATGVYPSDFC